MKTAHDEPPLAIPSDGNRRKQPKNIQFPINLREAFARFSYISLSYIKLQVKQIASHHYKRDVYLFIKATERVTTAKFWGEYFFIVFMYDVLLIQWGCFVGENAGVLQRLHNLYKTPAFSYIFQKILRGEIEVFCYGHITIVKYTVH